MELADETVEDWLRHVEIQRVWETPDPELTPEQIADLSSMFLDETRSSGDYRYLNAALKLNDWLREHEPSLLASLELDTRAQAELDRLEAEVGLS